MNCLRLSCLALGFFVLAPACEASVEISTAATKNMSCLNGVCSPTDKKAVLNVNDLTDMLVSGDVKITTGAGAVTITVAAPFSWTSTHRLTLDAYLTVSFRAPVTVAGTGAVTITTNDGGSGGDLIFFPGGKLDFWDANSNLAINGTTYAIVRSAARLVKEIMANPSGSFALAEDVEGKTYRTSPVAVPFTGQLEGLGNTIAHFTLRQYNTNRASGGFFSEVGAGGFIHNFALVDATMRQGSRSGDIGILGGVNFGPIARSRV